MAFQIIPIQDTPENHGMQWRNLQQSLQIGSFNPVPPAGASITGPTITGTGLTIQGYSSRVIDNIVYFIITATVTSGTLSITWANAQGLVLPTPVGQLGSTAGGIATTVATIYNQSTGASLGNLVITNNGKFGTLTNLTGATISGTPTAISIQGFYFTSK